VRGTPRMMMVSIGAGAAMEMGDVDKVKKYYQLVLRADPDQPEVGQQYKTLKKLLKLMGKADELLLKGYNHKALGVLDEALGLMRSLQMSSGTFRSRILLKLCAANSQIKRHEEALISCDQAVELRTVSPGDNRSAAVFVDPAALREALKTRAAALQLDNDHDEAVRDWSRALESARESGAAPEEQQDLQRSLMQAQQNKRVWDERRDHMATLELPANLQQLAPEKQCSWIKKQHRKLARKWHPDKYRGNSDRGARKMREVQEAKDVLYERFRC